MIKAIETSYKGYRFRSRLEARWAVFLDALQVPWEYEREGFDLGGLRYLPDFWLPFGHAAFGIPGAGFWLEIKGQPPTELEHEKAKRLAEGTGHHVIITVGAPDENCPLVWGRAGRAKELWALREYQTRRYPNGHQETPAEVLVGSILGDWFDIYDPCPYKKTREAVNAARAARFERA